MRFSFTGKQAVRFLGCTLFCLFICTMAFFNRTLLLEPVSDFLHGASFKTAAATVQQNYLSDRLRGKDQLITLNGGYARLLGRLLYNGTQQTTNGMLTSVTSEMRDTSAFSDNLDRFCRYLENRGIPFLFIMAPCKEPTEESILPVGVKDYTNALADQVLFELAERNVPTMDLRPDMSRTREQVEKYFYRTDHHWNVEGSFRAYQRIMKAIQAQFPETRLTYTDQGLWGKNIIPNWWLGTHGRRVGPLFGGVDDLDYYLPTFETAMSRYSLGIWIQKGDFREACIREWFLDHSDFFHLDNYSRYLGGGYPLTLHRNQHAENPLKLLILRDSFMLPVECFLSTELSSIDVLDPREYGVMSEVDYLALNPPDMVIMMIYPGVLPTQYYKYFTDFGESKVFEAQQETLWDEITINGTSGNEDYTLLPVLLKPGKSYQLTLNYIQVHSGDPDGANLALYYGDDIIDQTVFDIDYGNQSGFLWGFKIPDDRDDNRLWQLRLYAGVCGDTEKMSLSYQGIVLKEGVLREP